MRSPATIWRRPTRLDQSNLLGLAFLFLFLERWIDLNCFHLARFPLNRLRIKRLEQIEKLLKLDQGLSFQDLVIEKVDAAGIRT